MEPKKQVVYVKTESNFDICLPDPPHRLCLINKSQILIMPGVPNVVSLGVRIINPGTYAFLLHARGNKKVFCHIGLVDPGYKGDVRLILMNKTTRPVVIAAKQLKVSLLAFCFAVPYVLPINCPITLPQYPLDAGLDITLPQNLSIPPRTTAIVSISGCPHISPKFIPVILGRSGMASKGLGVKAIKWQSSPVLIKITNYSDVTHTFTAGARICQVVFMDSDHFKFTFNIWSNIKLSHLGNFSWSKTRFIAQGEDVDHSIIDLTNTGDGDTKRGSMGFGSSGL
nr:dUTPase [Bovine gammaherpesvirus 4]